MKPLPAQSSAMPKAADSAMPSLPTVLATPVASYSTANRRTSTCSVQRTYPWLLATSTAVAAAFCLLYITKPVITAAPSHSPFLADTPLPLRAVTVATKASLMPDQNRLPGEISEAPATAREPGGTVRSTAPAAFEQTNLRIQHILTAEAPGGHRAKIDLDVPVLYQSRNLRWTAAEVTEARDLLARLAGYQEKSRALRSEGAGLLDAWNALIARSIPAEDLRADSPTLPANQQDAADAPRPAGFDTQESIQIQPAGK